MDNTIMAPLRQVPPKLPEYAELLAARHQAHETELGRLVGELPLRPDHRILDVACGDGFYSLCFARRLGADGRIVALDLLTEFLEWARRLIRQSDGASQTCFVQGDAYCLPFADETFDFVWCAQSLITLDDPVAALREMRRVVREAGYVAILENDRLHEMVLPWPSEIEMIVYDAFRVWFQRQQRDPSGLEVGRHVQEFFRDAALVPQGKETFTVDRSWPLSPEDERFLQIYFELLWNHVRDELPPERRDQVERCIRPDSPDYLPRQTHFTMTYVDLLFLGRRITV